MWPAISALNQRVNECIGQTNSVISNARQVMACIEQAACENGAYYSPNEINVEEGYDAANSSKYFVTRIKPCASDGTPIRVQLKLAYDNTTNSRLQQNAFEASMAEFAQVMVPAVPVDQNLGWFGLAVWNDAPIQSSTLTNAYTAGFTKSGRFKWYSNSTDMAQLKRDQIQNAMGVYGILVAGGDITDPSLRAQIPNAGERMARVCIGQNYDTRETFILTCGNTDTNGMTSQACAAIMKQYGCDAAVECCQGSTVCALDKGQMLFTPDNHEVPAAYAYWYVTKKCSYRTQFVRELAELTQKYGQAIWAANLTYGSVSDIVDDIQTLTTDYGKLVTDIEVLKQQGGQSSALVTQLQSTVTVLEGRTTTLEEKVAELVSDSGSVGAQFQIVNNEIANLKTSLSQEIADRKSAITALQNNLNTEISNRSAADSQIRTLIDTLSATVTQNKSDCEAHVTDLQAQINQNKAHIEQELADLTATVETHSTNITTIQADITSIREQLTSDYNTLNALIQTNIVDIGNLKTQVASLLQSMTSLDEAVSNYTIELADIEKTLSGIKEVNVTILAQQQDLLDKYNGLPADLTEYSERLTALENSQQEVKTQFEALQTSFTELQTSFTELQTKQTALETAQAAIEENIQTLNSKVGQLETCCETTKTDIENLTELVTENQDNINSLKELLNMVPNLPVTENGLRIYISPTGEDQNDGLTPTTPVRSFVRAIKIAENNYNQPSFAFLFKSGETYNFPAPQINGRNTLFYSWNFETNSISTDRVTINFTGESKTWHMAYVHFNYVNIVSENRISLWALAQISYSDLTNFTILSTANSVQSNYTNLGLNGFLVISSGDIKSFYASSLGLIITTNLTFTATHANVHVIKSGSPVSEP